MNFNEKFSQFFANKSYTQNQIAEILEVSRPTINRIVNDNHTPSFLVLQNLARAFPYIDLDYFIRDDYDQYEISEFRTNINDDSLSSDLLSELQKMEIHIANIKQRLSQY